jgi:hypothetical protein
MQKILISCLIFLITISPLTAQPKFKQSYGTEKDYKRLWYLNNQYIQSWILSDTATYDKLLWAEDFVHQSGSDGHLYPKKDIMPVFGKKRFDDIEYFFADNTSIQFITDSVAMILSSPPYFGNGDNKESLSQYNDVYVKRNGNWICVSANITAVTEGNKPLPILKKIPAATKFVTILQGNKEDIEAITNQHTIVREIVEQRDYKKAKAVLDRWFMIISKNGHLLSKHKTVTKKKGIPYTIHNLFIRFVAADVAMVHGAAIYQLSNGEMTGVQFNDIYVKRDNTWKCVSSNNTPIKK